MKAKLFLPLLAALFISNVMMAQLKLGIKAGANIGKIEGRSFKDEFNYGYHLGGFAEIGFGGRLGIQPEVLFNQNSTTVSSDYEDIYDGVLNPSYQRDVKLNYLSIPLLVNYKLIGKFLTLQAGPQFGILIDGDRNLLQNGADAFKKGDFSMVGGVQLKLAMLRVSGRYTVGLNNINDIDNQDKWKNQGFQVSVGVAL